MVVDPKQLLENLTAEEERKLRSLEKRIDEDLTKRFSGSAIYYPYGSDFSELRANVLDRLLNRYRQAGWKVVIEHDQRDGSSIVFDYEPARYPKRGMRKFRADKKG